MQKLTSTICKCMLSGLIYTDDAVPSIVGNHCCIKCLPQAAASTEFENWGVVGPGLKTGGTWVINVQQTEARSTGLRVSSRNFCLIYIDLFISGKSPLREVYSCQIPLHYTI